MFGGVLGASSGDVAVLNALASYPKIGQCNGVPAPVSGDWVTPWLAGSDAQGVSGYRADASGALRMTATDALLIDDSASRARAVTACGSSAVTAYDTKMRPMIGAQNVGASSNWKTSRSANNFTPKVWAALFRMDATAASTRELVGGFFNNPTNGGFASQIAASGAPIAQVIDGAGSLQAKTSSHLLSVDGAIHGVLCQYNQTSGPLSLSVDRNTLESGSTLTGYTAPLSTGFVRLGVNGFNTGTTAAGLTLLGMVFGDTALSQSDVNAWFDACKGGLDIVAFPSGATTLQLWKLTKTCGDLRAPTTWLDEIAGEPLVVDSSISYNVGLPTLVTIASPTWGW